MVFNTYDSRDYNKSKEYYRNDILTDVDEYSGYSDKKIDKREVRKMKRYNDLSYFFYAVLFLLLFFIIMNTYGAMMHK